MAPFPKIARPCPYLDRLDSVMDGDFCRMCKRSVTDLTDMSGAERTAFMAACGGDACISYTTRLSPAVAAAALAASAVILVAPVPAMAQKHKPRHAHVRPVRVPPPPMYFTAGAPPVPQIEVAPPPEPAKPPVPKQDAATPREQPAAADRRPKPE